MRATILMTIMLAACGSDPVVPECGVTDAGAAAPDAGSQTDAGACECGLYERTYPGCEGVSKDTRCCSRSDCEGSVGYTTDKCVAGVRFEWVSCSSVYGWVEGGYCNLTRCKYEKTPYCGCTRSDRVLCECPPPS